MGNFTLSTIIFSLEKINFQNLRQELKSSHLGGIFQCYNPVGTLFLPENLDSVTFLSYGS